MWYLSDLEHCFGVIPTSHLIQQFIHKLPGDASTALYKLLEAVAKCTFKGQLISSLIS